MDAPHHNPDNTQPPAQVTLRQAFWYWLKLGFISFGGPAGQIALMHQEIVEKRRWISEHRFLHGLNFCMLLPGPEAIQLAIYISWLMHGIRGALVAGILFFMPAFIILSALAAIYLNYGDVPLVLGIFNGIKPAVVAIVLFAAWRIFIDRLSVDRTCRGHVGCNWRKTLSSQIQKRWRAWRFIQNIWRRFDRRSHSSSRTRCLFVEKILPDDWFVLIHLGIRDVATKRTTRLVRDG